MTWQDAFGHCAKLGGHLAVVNSLDEYHAVKATINEYETTQTYTRAWLDGTEHLLKGKWRCPSIPGPCPVIFEILRYSPRRKFSMYRVNIKEYPNFKKLLCQDLATHVVR